MKKLTQDVAHEQCLDVAEHILHGGIGLTNYTFDRYLQKCIEVINNSGYEARYLSYEEQAMIENAADNVWMDYQPRVSKTPDVKITLEDVLNTSVVDRYDRKGYLADNNDDMIVELMGEAFNELGQDASDLYDEDEDLYYDIYHEIGFLLSGVTEYKEKLEKQENAINDSIKLLESVSGETKSIVEVVEAYRILKTLKN